MKYLCLIYLDEKRNELPDEDCVAYDTAIQLASKIPPARVGSIEVRPIRPFRETVAESQQRKSNP